MRDYKQKFELTKSEFEEKKVKFIFNFAEYPWWIFAEDFHYFFNKALMSFVKEECTLICKFTTELGRKEECEVLATPESSTTWNIMDNLLFDDDSCYNINGSIEIEMKE